MIKGVFKFQCKKADLMNAIKQHMGVKDVVLSTNQDIDDSVNNLLVIISAARVFVGQSIGENCTSDIYMDIKADGSEIIEDDLMIQLTCTGGFYDLCNTCTNQFNEHVKKLQRLIESSIT